MQWLMSKVLPFAEMRCHYTSKNEGHLDVTCWNLASFKKEESCKYS